MKTFDKKVFPILVVLLIFSVNLLAQEVPYLYNPFNNQRYVQTEKLILRWFTVSGETTYVIEVAKDDKFTPASILYHFTRIGDNITLPSLSMNTTYWWRAKVDKDDAEWSSVWRFTTTVAPRPVVLVEPSNGAINLANDLVEFSWSKDSVNTSFELLVSEDAEFTDTARIFRSNYNFAETTNLTEGVRYYWKVKPYNVDGLPGQWSQAFSFKTRLKKPSLNFPVNFTNNQDTSIIFRWQKVPIASMYQFQLTLDEEFDSTEILIDSMTTYTDIKIENMLNDTIYYWRVKAQNAFKDTSSWSEEFAFKTKLKRIALLSPKKNSRNMEQDVELVWEQSKPFDTYRLQVATDSLFINKITNSFTEKTQANLLNLKKNTMFYWRVNNRNGVGDTSYWSRLNYFKTKLDKPKLKLPKNKSSNLALDLDFTWSEIKTVEWYDFQISESNSFVEPFLTDSVSDTTVTIDSLKLGRTYYWRIRGLNSDGDTSEWSDANEFSTFSLALSTSRIDSSYNVSKSTSDTLATFSIINGSKNIIKVDRIFTKPDSLFRTDVSSVSVPADSNSTIYVIGDLQKLKAGFNTGTIFLIKDLDKKDTSFIPIKVLVNKAEASFSVDSLNFDTTLTTIQKTKTFYLSNYGGNTVLEIKKIRLFGRDSASFHFENDIKKISARDSIPINVKFNPERLDSSFAYLSVITNSFINDEILLPITGVGKGGKLTSNTLAGLSNLENDVMSGLINSRRKVIIENEGNLLMQIYYEFVNNYFRITNKEIKHKLNPGDTTSITLQYITPNFDSLNVDTLIVYNDGVGENPLKFVLKGTIDTVAVKNFIASKMEVDGKTIETLSAGLTVADNSSIQTRFLSDIFEQETNYHLRVGYYTGGPGSKKYTYETNDGRFIIPYSDVDVRGLSMKADIYSFGYPDEPIDSLNIFDSLDVQVNVNNYTPGKISVPLSVPAETVEKADVNWVLFGYPFDEIRTDTLFNDFGKVEKMEDGTWTVYEYNPSTEEFNLFTEKFLQSGKAYFIAQAIRKGMQLDYSYANTVTSRKLNDNNITLPKGVWKTISSPYTFEVEVDTPAVLYRYDTPTKSYRLTNLMRPGEGYFVPPDISELTLKTYGSYFPVLFPKAISDREWFITLQAANNNKKEVLYVYNNPQSLLKSKTGDGNYVKAPSVDNSFEFYLKEGDEKFTAVGTDLNATFNVTLYSHSHDEIELSSSISGNVPAGLNTLLYDPTENMIVGKQKISIGKNQTKQIKLVVGDKDYLSRELKQLMGTPESIALQQNYPNPFNPTSNIRYQIVQTSQVNLSVYNLLGEKVMVLVNQEQTPGYYQIEIDGSKLASGVYFYQLTTPVFKASRKMLLLK